VARKRLDVVLVERGLAESRARAQAAIEAGAVTVNGRPALKPAEAVDANASIIARPAHPWVGRAALKLDHALSIWPVRAEGRVVLDVGASTGGFTEVCLIRGAARVYAVDVGRGQLHERLAADPRVVSLETTDARELDRRLIPEPTGLIVCDVSFIGLAKALPAALALAEPGADLIALVKPQFEVGPGKVGKGGLVTRRTDQDAALAATIAFVESSGWAVRDSAESPILGGDGNREFLLWASKPALQEATSDGPSSDDRPSGRRTRS
jgi:23S rRNA (cytidine1920-2'-O)/16S rRNA (cytidine1409-2'-O)-methyltransferase